MSDSLVRENMLSRLGYTPYCLAQGCRAMPRMVFDGEQMKCPSCGNRTDFEPEFIDRYKRAQAGMRMIAEAGPVLPNENR